MDFVNNLNKPKTYLLIGNVFLVFFLILLNNLGVLPLSLGDFLFFAFLTLALAMYRPGWCFLLFVGTIPLENINLAPASFGIDIRPYQFIGAIIILALGIRLLTKRLSFKLIKPKWYDWLVIIFVAAGFLSVLGAPDKIISLKLSFIIGTFAALYFLVRNYIQDSEDLKRVVPFFLSSSAVVVLYGIWQNIIFLFGARHFEVMPGRPNATFTEADWLGVFLVLLTSVIYVLIYHHARHSERIEPACRQAGNLLYGATSDDSEQISRLAPPKRSSLEMTVFSYVFLTLIFILLIITVSRSAWLGAFFVTIIFLFTILTNLRFRNWQWRETINIKLKIVASLAVSIAIVYIFHLTNFQLFNRVESTGTGLQEITVACAPCAMDNFGEGGCQWKPFPIKEKVIVDENNKLEEYNCRHINLEEQEAETAKGNFISTAFRKDPNINIRAEIYQKSWVEIKNHPVLGIGWGSINNILGTDGRGTPLNSSNIFLETWLGSGIIGLLALVTLLAYILLKTIKNYYYATDSLQKAVSLFILISWFGLIIANLFNAGVLLGIFWVWLAVAMVHPVE